VPNNGHATDPHALVARLAEAFVRNGGHIHRRRALGFTLDGNRLRAIRTPEGELPADAAVIAAGAFSKTLAAAVGDRVPLETERGYHLMLRDPPVMPRVPTTDADGKFVATPMANGLRFAGTVELAGLGAPPNWRRARMLFEQGRRMLPGLGHNGEIAEDRISVWMGHRPSLPDSLPVIGASRASPDVFHAFGHGHVGMTGAPATGQVVADLVAGRPPSIDLAPFRADRFG
jgi:D-amino-acid dehydrogenase